MKKTYAALMFIALFFSYSKTVIACELSSSVSGVERNTSGCDKELRSYGSPQPGGQCVALISSVEILSESLKGGGRGCSKYQVQRAKDASYRAISTLRRAQYN